MERGEAFESKGLGIGAQKTTPPSPKELGHPAIMQRPAGRSAHVPLPEPFTLLTCKALPLIRKA